MLTPLPSDISTFIVLLGLCLLTKQFWPAVKYTAVLSAGFLLWLMLWAILGQFFGLYDFAFLQEIDGWKALALVNCFACLIAAIPSLVFIIRFSNAQAPLFRLCVAASLGAGIIITRIHPEGTWPPFVYAVVGWIAFISVIFAICSGRQPRRKVTI